eukprot:contig_10106_g2415
MEGLQQWMKENRFSDYFSAFVDKLGVESVDDLQLVMAADLPIVGLKPVQARRFTSLLSARGSVPVATAPSSSPQPAEPPTTNTAVASQSTDSTWLCADERRNSREAAIGGDGRSDSPSDCEVDSDGDYDGNPGARVTPPTKRRKINRLSKKQRVGALRSDMEGTARVRLHESRAIEAAHVPIVKMTKSAIASSPNVDALVARIRRPDDCLLSAQQFFKSSALNTVFDVTASVEHGLCGAPSNRTKVAERNLFVEF